MGEARGEHWRVSDAVAWTTSFTDIVVLDLRSLTAHPMTLEQTAAYVWEEIALNGPITTEALVANVAAAYEVADDVVRHDILSLLERLRDEHLVTTSSPAGPWPPRARH
ncbi:PqqD family protein [Microbacterium sp. NPDC056052]|uniref:PqqD family protein n=1 Tax=Microbacterium sp. NPDC056052 TaxID=3345695 RepID=UPI0035E0937A